MFFPENKRPYFTVIQNSGKLLINSMEQGPSLEFYKSISLVGQEIGVL
jgi:hypothetical protein